MNLRSLRLPAAMLTAVLLCLHGADVRGQDDGPTLLMVPLIAPPDAPEWLGSALDRALEEKLAAFDSVSFAEGEEKMAALKSLATASRIGPDELAAALAAGGADFAVVGQFSLETGILHVDVRVFSAAEKRQTASLQKSGSTEEAFPMLAEAARAVGTAVGAELSEEAAARLDRAPSSSLEAFHLYHTARSEEDRAKRLELFRRAVEIDPGYREANLRAGLELYGEGRTREALPYMEKAVALGPDLPEAHNNLAVLYAELDRKKDALAEFEKALNLKPDYPEARLNYGRLLEESGRYDQAENVYTDLLEENPDNVKARSSLALIYEKTGRTELAIQEFRVLSRRSPELAEEYFLTNGREARRAKDYEKAEKFFQRVVDINPQFARGYAELGTTAYLAGDYDRSVKYFQQALALEPQNGEFHYYLGLSRERIDQPKEAKQSFLRSGELGGPLGARVSLAGLLLAEGEVMRAVDELNLVLDEDPGNTEAKELLSRAMTRAETQQKREQDRAELATHRLERLESIVEEMTRANRELESRLLSGQSDRQALEEELETLRAERGVREQEYRSRMEESIQTLQERLAAAGDFDQDRREYQDRIQDLESELSQARQAIVDVQNREVIGEGKVEEALASEKARSATLEQELRELKRQQGKSLKEIGRLEDEVEKKRGEVAEKLEEMAELERKEIRLQEEKAVEGRELSRARERSSSLEKRVESLQKDLERQRGEVVKARSERSEGVGEAARLREQLEEVRKESASLEKDLAEARIVREEAVTKLSVVQSDLETSQTRVRESKEEHEETLSALRSDLEGVKKELDESRARESGLQERLLAAVSSSESELSDVRLREVDARQESEMLRRRIDALEEQTASLQEQVRQRETEVAEGAAQVELFREKERDLLLERDRLQRSIAGFEADNAEGRDREQRAIQARDDVLKELEGARGEIAGQALELGRLFMRSRSWEKAAVYFEKVIEADPRSGEAYYSLGEIYFQLGRFDLSKQMYERAKSIY